MADIVSKKELAQPWRVASVVLAVVIFTFTILYVWAAPMHTVALTGCTPTKDIGCTAQVNVEPQSAIVIAGLIIGTYLAATAISGQILTLKIGDNSIGAPADTTKADEATEEQKKDASDPVKPEGLQGAHNRRVAELDVPDRDVSLSLYRALPNDIRTTAEALWNEWGYGDTPLAVSMESASTEPGQGNRPYVITARVPGTTETRSIRVSKDSRKKSTVTIRESDGIRIIKV